MPFSENFSVSQAVALPSEIDILDTSTGSDPAIDSRRVWLTKYDGTFLVPSGTLTNYIPWPLGSSTITVDVLDIDYALNLKVQWLDSGGGVLYEKTVMYAFTIYAEIFYYLLTQQQTAAPNIVNDPVWYPNKIQLRVHIDDATQAVNYGNDIFAAQRALNAAKYMMDNQANFF